MVTNGKYLNVNNRYSCSSRIISITQTNVILEGPSWTESWTDYGEDYVVEIDAAMLLTRDPNGFTTNNTNQRKGNTSWINKRN